MLNSIIAESPYFDMLLRGGFKDAGIGRGKLVSGAKIKCHVCGESHCTLLKAGKDTYICKDCKMLEGLNEE